jgi:hypothetical protein
MNSKDCAKLAFGNPGFFDFLAPVTNFLKPVSAPLVKLSTDVGSALYGRDFGRVASTPEAQALGQNLFSVGVLSGGAIAGGAVVAPALAGLSLPTALGTLGSQVQKAPALLGNILGEETDTGSTQEDDAEDDSLGNDGDY